MLIDGNLFRLPVGLGYRPPPQRGVHVGCELGDLLLEDAEPGHLPLIGLFPERPGHGDVGLNRAEFDLQRCPLRPQTSDLAEEEFPADLG